ncbi:MAG: nucleotidyltransferase family protein [Candidatus Omnitrophica bacterium]|nr:nucleotidyltransferase family protein [Candidatus Omnitrophota bacterium]
MSLFLREEEKFLEFISLQNFSGDFNDEFINFLKEYNLGCLLYSLFLQKKVVLPTILRENLRGDYIVNLKRQMMQLNNIRRIAEIFDRQNIPFIVLKSPILAKKIYDDEGARRVGCDIDILIKKDNFYNVDRVLNENGYKNPLRYETVDLKYRCFLYIKKNSTPIDIHLKVLSGIMFLDLFLSLNKDCWQDFNIELIYDIKIKYFFDELLAVYLVMLFTKEESRFNRFQYLIDLYFFLKKYKEKLDYFRLADFINKSNLNSYFLFSLDLLNKYTHLSLPLHFLKKIKFNRFRKGIVYWALSRYLKSDMDKSLRFFTYSLKAFSFSGGYLNKVLKSFLHIYKVSYFYFLEEIGLKNNLHSFLMHFLFFLRRTFSCVPRKFTLEKIAKK